jgi:hypothetical protein
MEPFYVMMIGPSVYGSASASEQEIRKRAQGHLLSRGSDTTAVSVRRVIPGAPQSAWPVVATVRRKKPRAPLTWTESADQPR